MSNGISFKKSEAQFKEAQKLMPGGVSSPVRAFKSVGGTPLFIKEALGCTITDVDGNEYIDYVGSYGPIIAGHANDTVIAALSKAIGHGTSYGAPTCAEIELATLITDAIPSIEMIRFVNSGTEAAMSAIRLARAATGRDLVVKCVGCYHGHVDGLLVEAGSGALTLGTPSSPGIPKGVAGLTLLVQYNDLEEARTLFEKYKGQIACFCIEPVVGNMGVVIPNAGYLQGLRKLCDEFGVLLLFDEVMTGFRVAWGGAQVRYNIQPDITCLGKVIGGGLPVGAYGASKKIMSLVSPAGPVYQAGTLSGNPLAMAGGIATLEIMKEPIENQSAYDILEERADQLEKGLREAARKHSVPVVINRVGSMITPFFSTLNSITNFREATSSDTKAFGRFFHAMLENGVYLPPSQYEAWFVSLAHTSEAIDKTIEAADAGFAAAR